eukprot:31162-Pelagococcus_subviridis.AAC.10
MMNAPACDAIFAARYFAGVLVASATGISASARKRRSRDAPGISATSPHRALSFASVSASSASADARADVFGSVSWSKSMRRSEPSRGRIPRTRSRASRTAFGSRSARSWTIALTTSSTSCSGGRRGR